MQTSRPRNHRSNWQSAAQRCIVRRSSCTMDIGWCFLSVVLFLLSAITTTLGGYEPIGERIFGGDDAEENEFPTLAYIRAYKYNPIKKRMVTEYCGGSIISEKWILTSGHCVRDSNTLFVGVGSSNRTKAKYLEVKRFILHEKLRLHGRNNNNAENDVGLIELKDPIDLDYLSTDIARLARELQTVSSKKGAVVVGWGRTTYKPSKPGHESPKMLKRLSVNVIPCPGDTENVICISSRQGTGVCDGDSGGPLLVNSEVYGVASYVDNANPDPHLDPNKHCIDAGTWAVYMSVPHYRLWIQEHSGV